MNITSIDKQHEPASGVFNRCLRARPRRVKVIEPKAAFEDRIARNEQYRHWVVVHLFRNGQTPHEQDFHVTRDLNHIGFNAVDAPILSVFAEMIEAGKPLLATEEVVLAKTLAKYWRQFTHVSLLGPDFEPERRAA